MKMLRILRNEEGSVLIVALLLLVCLTLIGIAATTTTTTDIQIAGNEKSYKTAFYNADSGIYATPKLISAHVDDTTTLIAIPGINYLIGDSNFDRQIKGFDSYDGGAEDIRIALGGNNVDVDVERMGSEVLGGGGAEFASGAEGIGVGSAGGVAISYELDSFGDGPANSTSNIGAVYRKVVGIPGGL